MKRRKCGFGKVGLFVVGQMTLLKMAEDHFFDWHCLEGKTALTNRE